MACLLAGCGASIATRGVRSNKGLSRIGFCSISAHPRAPREKTLVASAALLRLARARVALARERYFDRGERPTGLVSEAVLAHRFFCCDFLVSCKEDQCMTPA
jgi:hypothetical protein